MKDSRQRILDKLAKTQGVKKASKRKINLSEINVLKERFSEDYNRILEIKAELISKLEQASTQANYLIDEFYDPELLDDVDNTALQISEILGEVPIELLELQEQMRDVYTEASELGSEYDSGIYELLAGLE